MTVTDATLKTNIRAILNEPANPNGKALLNASDVPYDIDAYIDTLLPVSVAMCSLLAPNGGVNRSSSTTLVDPDESIALYEYTFRANLGDTTVANINFNFGIESISLSDVTMSNFATKLKSAILLNARLSQICTIENEEGAYLKIGSSESLSISLSDIEHPAVNEVTITTVPGSGTLHPYASANETVRLLPTDFIRLNVLSRLDDGVHHRPVTSIVDIESELGKAQFNGNTRSKDDNPILMNYWCEDKRAVMLTPAIGDMTYVFDYDKHYNSNEGLTTYHSSYASAVCFMTASLIYEAFEEAEYADRFAAIAYELLGYKRDE